MNLTRVQPTTTRAPIVLPIADQQVGFIGGDHTISVFKGTIDMGRLKTCLAVALDHAPIFGGALQYHPLACINLPLCLPMFSLGQGMENIWSFYQVGFGDGTGATIRSQAMPAVLENSLSVTDSPEATWRRLATLSKEEVKLFNDEVGNKDKLMNTRRPLTTIVVSQGAQFAVLGLSISHIIADGRSYYAFFDLLCRLYSSAVQPPMPLPRKYDMAHLDNGQQKQCLPVVRPIGNCRSSLGPCGWLTRIVQTGSCCAHMCCEPCIVGEHPPPVRIFQARLTREDQAKLKSHIAAKRPSEPPPYSTLDAMVEAFAPPTSYAPYTFGMVLDMRGRVASLPSWEALRTSGNGDTVVIGPADGAMSHAQSRTFVQSAFTGGGSRPLPWTAILSDRQWGWNSWESISREAFSKGGSGGTDPLLAGLELRGHQQTIMTPSDWSPVLWQKGFVTIADDRGTRTLRLDPVNAEHAEQVQATLEELGLAYVCTDQKSRERAGAGAEGKLYDNLKERSAHDKNGGSCAGCGPCCTCLCIGACLYMNLAHVFDVLFLGHLTPCFPYEQCCCVQVGSMPQTLPAGRTASGDTADPAPLLGTGAPDAQTMVRDNVAA